MISSVIDIDWMVDLTQQQIIERLAFSQIGRPYKWGGQSPNEGFDCSGFVIWLLQQVGLFPLGRDMTANDMWKQFNPYMNEAAGQCVFYGDKNKATHVMLQLDDDFVIGACGDAGVCVRLVNYRDDFLGFAAPRG